MSHLHLAVVNGPQLVVQANSLDQSPLRSMNGGALSTADIASSGCPQPTVPGGVLTAAAATSSTRRPGGVSPSIRSNTSLARSAALVDHSAAIAARRISVPRFLRHSVNMVSSSFSTPLKCYTTFDQRSEDEHEIHA